MHQRSTSPTIHPSSNPMPDLAPDEFEALKADIQTRGVLSPVLYASDGQTLVDGHQRLRAWVALGKDPADITSVQTRIAPDDARQAGIVVNTFRRHLTREQRDEQIARLRAMGMSVEDVAKATKTSTTTVSRVATPEAIAKVEPGVSRPGKSSTATTTAKQQAQGKQPTSARGGRPRAAATIATQPKSKPQPKQPVNVRHPWRPVLMRALSHARPEDRAVLVEMRDRMNAAIEFIDTHWPPRAKTPTATQVRKQAAAIREATQEFVTRAPVSDEAQKADDAAPEPQARDHRERQAAEQAAVIAQATKP